MLSLRPRQLLLLSLLAAFATMALKTLAWYFTGSDWPRHAAGRAQFNTLGDAAEQHTGIDCTGIMAAVA